MSVESETLRCASPQCQVYNLNSKLVEHGAEAVSLFDLEKTRAASTYRQQSLIAVSTFCVLMFPEPNIDLSNAVKSRKCATSPYSRLPAVSRSLW